MKKPLIFLPRVAECYRHPQRPGLIATLALADFYGAAIINIMEQLPQDLRVSEWHQRARGVWTLLHDSAGCVLPLCVVIAHDGVYFAWLPIPGAPRLRSGSNGTRTKGQRRATTNEADVEQKLTQSTMRSFERVRLSAQLQINHELLMRSMYRRPGT